METNVIIVERISNVAVSPIAPNDCGKEADVLARIRAFNAEISRLSFTKPHVNFPLRDVADDPRYLVEVELRARGLKGIGHNQYSIDQHLTLPDFDEPARKFWPPPALVQDVGPRVVYRGSHANYEALRASARRQAAYYERLKREERERRLSVVG